MLSFLSHFSGYMIDYSTLVEKMKPYFAIKAAPYLSEPQGEGDRWGATAAATLERNGKYVLFWLKTWGMNCQRTKMFAILSAEKQI